MLSFWESIVWHTLACDHVYEFWDGKSAPWCECECPFWKCPFWASEIRPLLYLKKKEKERKNIWWVCTFWSYGRVIVEIGWSLLSVHVAPNACPIQSIAMSMKTVPAKPFRFFVHFHCLQPSPRRTIVSQHCMLLHWVAAWSSAVFLSFILTCACHGCHILLLLSDTTVLLETVDFYVMSTEK